MSVANKDWERDGKCLAFYVFNEPLMFVNVYLTLLTKRGDKALQAVFFRKVKPEEFTPHRFPFNNEGSLGALQNLTILNNDYKVFTVNAQRAQRPNTTPCFLNSLIDFLKLVLYRLMNGSLDTLIKPFLLTYITNAIFKSWEVWNQHQILPPYEEENCCRMVGFKINNEYNDDRDYMLELLLAESYSLQSTTNISQSWCKL
uniref:Uncharacterized protein n=1 Tax=Glossina brevipalpis TaxID=37001 RepID=A0A1A9WQ60_9MUSC